MLLQQGGTSEVRTKREKNTTEKPGNHEGDDEAEILEEIEIEIAEDEQEEEVWGGGDHRRMEMMRWGDSQMKPLGHQQIQRNLMLALIPLMTLNFVNLSLNQMKI